MERVSIGEVVAIEQSVRRPAGETVWLLNLDMVEQQTGRVVQQTRVRQADIGSSTIAFDENHVLYSKLRPNLNKVVLPNETGIATSELLPLRPDTSRLDRAYLAVFLRSPQFVARMCEKTAGAKMPRVSPKVVLASSMPLPPLNVQRRIATQMMTIDRLTELRKEQLRALDELVKSQFIEMFGDPEDNPFHWPKLPLSKVLRGDLSNGFFAKRDEYVANGNVAVLGVANIVNRMYSNCCNLPRAFASEAEISKYAVRYGDLLFCRSSLVAEGIGKASMVPRDVPEKVLFECHAIRVPLNLEKTIPEFMQVLTTTEFYRRQILAQAKTATMTTIGQNDLIKTKIILPPIDLQKSFCSFIRHTDKSKFAIHQSLSQLTLLKNSLAQKYFS